MANRTTAPRVKQILETELTDENIEAYISIASSMVDDVAAVGGVSADRLTEMERWLTAHLIAVTKERRPVEEEIGNDTAVKFANVFGPGLQSTEYGQMTSQLDPTGTLAAYGKKKIDITAITSFE
jgi:hypothetical protein